MLFESTIVTVTTRCSKQDTQAVQEKTASEKIAGGVLDPQQDVVLAMKKYGEVCRN